MHDPHPDPENLPTGQPTQAAPERPTAAPPLAAMVSTISVAVAPGATAEARAAGARACRTLLAALAARAGQPIAFPGAPPPSPLAGIAPDQALDLLIARLRALVPTEAPQSTPARPGLRIPIIQPPPRNGGSVR